MNAEGGFRRPPKSAAAKQPGLHSRFDGRRNASVDVNTTPPNAGTPVAQLERELAFVTDVIAQGARALALLVDVQVLCHDELADAKRSAAAGGGRGAR